jgi:acyl transferase domain-containing protein/non-ribosomal peptide synthetase component F
LSARSETALEQLVQRYQEFLESEPEHSLRDICFTANTGRAHFSFRTAVIGADAESMKQLLQSFTKREKRSPSIPKIAFLFTGQGSQYLGMGRQLYDTNASFRRTLHECDEILRPHLGTSLLSVLYPAAGEESEAAKRIDETGMAQPALFSVEYALAKLWQQWGVEPDMVLGHSVGELVAACIAGVFKLEDGLRLVAERGRVMQALPRIGTMAAVFASEERVREAIAPYRDDLSIAALNGPEQIVISGAKPSLEAALKNLSAEGIKFQELNVSHAFHSPLMEQARDTFLSCATTISYVPQQLKFVSTVDGKIASEDTLVQPGYWWRNIRETVNFRQAVKTAADAGANTFLEIGPTPTLITFGRRSVLDSQFTWLPSLRRGSSDWQIMLQSLGELYVNGVSVNWQDFDKEGKHRRVSLPTYPFERSRYWIELPNEVKAKPIEVKQMEPKKEQPTTTPMTTPTTTPTTTPRANRKEDVIASLRPLIARFLELDPQQLDIHMPFLEMGADSLVLIEAVQAIESMYGIELGIRDFFENLTTLDALAEYLNAQLPAEVVEEHVSSLEPLIAVPGSPSSLEQIMQQQLNTLSQVISQQLAVLESAHGKTLKSLAPKVIVNAKKAEGTQSTSEKPYVPYQRIQRESGGGLNDRQRAHLDSLIDRYNARTPRSKEKTQTNRAVLADNRASAGFRLSIKEMLYPIVAERSAGSKIWDIDGNEYLDLTMGFGAILFGHNPPFIMNAVAEQMKLGIQLGPQSHLAGEVAALISELTGMQRVTFCNSGTEAVMTALRLARTATKRKKVAIFAGSYHGTFDGVLAIARNFESDAQGIPVAPGVTPGLVEDVLVLEYGAERSLEVLRAHAHELAGVLVEPVQSRKPDLQPREFLHELRNLTTAAGAALIFDEVITGFRIHSGGAQAWFGVSADLATYGKIIGGGMPIGIVAGSAQFMDGIDGGAWSYGDGSYPQADTTFFAGTFCKHPLTMAAAKAALEQLKSDGPVLQETLNRRTSELAEKLNSYFESDDVPIRIVRFGSLFRFHFSGNMDVLFYHLLEKGIYIWEGRNCFLSTAHTDDDLEQLITAVKESVAEMRAGGFLPDSKRVESAPLEVRLSDSQQHAWLLSQLEAETVSASAGNLSMTLRLQGRLKIDAMNQAFAEVIKRHESLRTTFPTSGDRQQINASMPIESPLIDLTSWSDEERENKLNVLLEEENRYSFDLVNGPLTRVCWFRLGEESHVLSITVHHLVADGWSMIVLAQEVGELYNTYCQGLSAQLPPPVQFREYLQRGNAGEGADGYWRNQLRDLPPSTEFPGAHSRSAQQTYAGAREQKLFDPALCSELAKTSARSGATLFMTLLAAYKLLINQLTGDRDLVVVVPSAGQATVGGRHLIGDCTTLLPLRTNVDESQSFVAYLDQVKSVLFSAHAHATFSFNKLIGELRPPRDPSRWPFFNLDRALVAPKLHELEVSFIQPPISATNFDLSFNVTQIGKELSLAIDYKTRVFDAQTIQSWMQHYETLLRAIVAQPDAKLQDLPRPVLSRHGEGRQPDAVKKATRPHVPASPLSASLTVMVQANTSEAQPEPQTSYIAPRNEVEEWLALTWSETLGMDRCGVNDNFLSLGGHSLLATQLISRVREQFKVDVPLTPMFEQPTIANLALWIERLRNQSSGPAVSRINRAPRSSALPVSLAQQRLWFIEQLDPGNIAYNLLGGVRLTGKLDVSALERAFTEIIKRHESLRTTFAIAEDGTALQIIKSSEPFSLLPVDLRDLSAEDRLREAHARGQAEARKPFDLTNGPLMRVDLLQFDDEEHVIILTMHHIVSDGWSVGVLFWEVAKLYEAFAAGKESPLPELPIQYADYAIWQREYLEQAGLNDQLGYWLQQLDGAPLLTKLPSDRPRLNVPGFHGANEPFTIPQSLTESLREFSKTEGVTLFTTLLAAFKSLLHRHSGQDDLIVGTDIANRNRVETEGLIGFFVNLLALRTDLSGDPSFRELVRRVKTVTTGAYAHQDVPFEKIVSSLRPDRSVSKTPFVQVLFVMQNAPTPPIKLPGLSLEALPFYTETAEFELIVTLEEAGEEISGSFAYSSDLFERSTIVRLQKEFRTLLHSAFANPDQPLSSLSLLDHEELQGLSPADFPDAELSVKDLENLVTSLNQD